MKSSLIMNKAIFLDRDGVLNEDPGFLHKIEDLKFYPGVIYTLIELSKTDYKIIIVTNQPGIGRGLYSELEYLAFEKEYLDRLAKQSEGKIRIDKIYYCPHHPTKGIGKYKKICECRKPEPGMLLNAQKDFNIDFSKSFMIGDKRSDIQAGQTVGCKTILVETGCAGKGGEGCDVSPDFILKQLIQIRNIVNELS
jgi:D-glycero-D-manno-heptose 1,7-bisphosphate phosphatase